MGQIPIIIPAYEPDQRLLSLLHEFEKYGIGPVILVNDGSGDTYQSIFDEAEKLITANGGCVLTHPCNMGKGRALKTAFSYVLEKYPAAIGAVTADSDGQHSAECIKKVADALEEHPNHLILGVRELHGTDIPWKSRLGNTITEKVFAYAAGTHITDTQTGLRGIPAAFMRELGAVKGDRFEFEMQMLLECAGKYEITEIPIKTIYDSKENHQTHFKPVRDSIRIYRILSGKFIRYILSAVSSCAIDLSLFTVFCIWLKPLQPQWYVAMATVFARIISATYNYSINYKIVFKSSEAVGRAAIKYIMLAVVQMSASALFATILVRILPVLPEVVTKLIVDVALFFLSYYIQQKYVFVRGKRV